MSGSVSRCRVLKLKRVHHQVGVSGTAYNKRSGDRVPAIPFRLFDGFSYMLRHVGA